MYTHKGCTGFTIMTGGVIVIQYIPMWACYQLFCGITFSATYDRVLLTNENRSGY